MPRPFTPAQARENQLAATRPPWTAQNVAHFLEAHFAVESVEDVTTTRPELSWVVLVQLDDGARYYVTVERRLDSASVYDVHTGG